jgi:hypothetical protein
MGPATSLVTKTIVGYFHFTLKNKKNKKNGNPTTTNCLLLHYRHLTARMIKKWFDYRVYVALIMRVDFVLQLQYMSAKIYD